MAEIQIRSIDNPISGGYKKGDIIHIFPNDYFPDDEVWNSPKSVLLRIPDATEEYIAENFMESAEDGSYRRIKYVLPEAVDVIISHGGIYQVNMETALQYVGERV
jgi:hypothetical protein